MTSPSDIEIDRVAKVYGSGATAVRALDEVSLAIAENAFFTLLGPSGCGKTTLLRLIAGFESPSAGAIRLGGRDVSGLTANRRPVNTVFQNYALFPHMSVAENIGFGLRMLGKSRTETRETVARMLAMVRMEALADRRPGQISGGQQQRVALARALAPAPRVLLLDEPLSALDLKLRKEMQGELKRLQGETGITFLFVTHDQEEALTMSDRIAVMAEGRVLQVGSPREIYDHPTERFVADFIGDTNFLDAVLVRDGCGARVRLNGTAPVPAHLPEGMAARDGATVTVVVRPEHARLDPQGPLAGRVTGLVYFGTDTLVHLRLDGGAAFTLRRQNGAGGPALPEVGAEVRVALVPGGLQVLRA